MVERIRAYLAWQESPEFQPCERCHGKGYHHGFGEGGVDPDWCESCGGPGEVPTAIGMVSPDDLLKEAADTLASLSSPPQEEDPTFEPLPDFSDTEKASRPYQPTIELPEQGTREDFARVTKYWRQRAQKAEAELSAASSPPPEGWQPAVFRNQDGLTITLTPTPGDGVIVTDNQGNTWTRQLPSPPAPSGSGERTNEEQDLRS